MSDYALAFARGGDARALASECAGRLSGATGHNLGFVYATSPVTQHFDRLVEDLRERTGISDWVGTVGHGICATGLEAFDGPAAVVRRIPRQWSSRRPASLAIAQWKTKGGSPQQAGDPPFDGPRSVRFRRAPPSPRRGPNSRRGPLADYSIVMLGLQP